MLSIEQVGFSYHHGKHVLDSISFTVSKGESVSLLGSNGTGKSTLLKCILNYYHPQRGRILLDDRPIREMSSMERASRLAYVPQSSVMTFPYTVWEAVMMGRVCRMRLGAAPGKHDIQKVEEVLDRLGIADMADKKFQTLSGGERQMVLVGRALAQEAEYLIMDEPTSALDYCNQIRILELIRSLSMDGYGILMTTHAPDHAFLACTKTVMMSGGCVMESGQPDKVVNSDSLSRLYHVPVCVTEAMLKNKGEETSQKVCIPILKRREK